MISKLKSVLQDSVYNGKTNIEVAAMLNAPLTVQKEYMLTDVRLAASIGTVKAVAVVEAFKAQGDSVSLWIVEKMATTGLDIGNPEAPYFVSPLVNAGVITQDEADRVLNMGKQTTSRAEQLGLGTVMDYHVEEARNG